MGATGRDRIKRQSLMRRRSKHLIDTYRQRDFDLQVMEGASAASRLVVELRCPLLWQRFEGQAFGSGPDFMAVGPVAAPGAGD